jgi:heme exporter protein A
MNSADGLTIDRVHVWRGERHVLKGVSLALKRGELLHVTGPNGTGKTTLLRVASGLVRPEKGEVAWLGRPIASDRARYQGALAYAPHEPALKGDLTPLENLRFMVGLKRRAELEELRGYLDRAGVGECADLPVRVLSAGQRRRVSMARVLGLRVPLWLLDEPFTNLDLAGSKLLSGLLADHIDGGGMALVVAHHELEVTTSRKRLELAA